MSHANCPSHTTRRQFLKEGGSLVAGVAAMGTIVPSVFAAEDNTIRLALIGCGGRGAGAVGDALRVPDAGPIKLYAMADLSANAMKQRHDALKQEFPDKVDVPDDRRFVGFDAYRKAIDLLKPGDIAMCTTRAYIRPIHVAYAVKKGINVFMEKPFASDPGSLHILLAAAEEAEKKNVKIAAGVQCRHSPARQQLIQQIRDGVMGDIPVIRKVVYAALVVVVVPLSLLYLLSRPTSIVRHRERDRADWREDLVDVLDARPGDPPVVSRGQEEQMVEAVRPLGTGGT